MTEPVNSEPGKARLTRRDFLKILGVGAGAAYLTACSPEQAKTKPEYETVEAGLALKLDVQGEGQKEVKVFYRPTNPAMEKLQIRKVEGARTFLPFADGTSQVRSMHEILEPKLQKVARNHTLGEGVWVGLHVSAGYEQAILPDLPKAVSGEEYHAIPIVTNGENWMGEGQPAYELNAGSNGLGEGEVKSFGKGWAVGKYDGNAGNFTIVGYVKDARAMEVVGD